jgi:hypothetical protein
LNWHNLTHGTSSLILLYAVVLVAVLAGLLKGRAPSERYLWLPATALLAAIIGVVVASVVATMSEALTHRSAATAGGALLGFAIVIMVGFIAGLISARGIADRTHKRGSLVLDGQGSRTAPSGAAMTTLASAASH